MNNGDDEKHGAMKTLQPSCAQEMAVAKSEEADAQVLWLAKFKTFQSFWKLCTLDGHDLQIENTSMLSPGFLGNGTWFQVFFVLGKMNLLAALPAIHGHPGSLADLSFEVSKWWIFGCDRDPVDNNDP